MTLRRFTRIRAWKAAALVSGIVLVVATLGALAGHTVSAATFSVNVGEDNGNPGSSADEYNAADITIAEGDTVDWNWYASVHDVTSYAELTPGTPDWHSPLMSGPTTFSRTFNTAGVVTYYCTIHATRADAAPGVVDANIAAGKMVGKIAVDGAATDTPTPTDAPPSATPTHTPGEPTATATDAPPTATPTTDPATPTATGAPSTPTVAPPTATSAATPAGPTATATSVPATATATPTVTLVAPTTTVTVAAPTTTPGQAVATATPTGQPTATSEPTTREEPTATLQPRTVNVEAGTEWFGEPGFQSRAYEIRINAGDTVQWNIVNGVHTVYECGDNWSGANGCAAATWSSDILQTGDIFTQRFTAAGTYYYLCTLHPLNMRGVIAVAGSAPPSVGGPVAPPAGNPGLPTPRSGGAVPTRLSNSGSGPLPQDSARSNSPFNRVAAVAAAAAALLAVALVWKEVGWRSRT